MGIFNLLCGQSNLLLLGGQNHPWVLKFTCTLNRRNGFPTTPTPKISSLTTVARPLCDNEFLWQVSRGQSTLMTWNMAGVVPTELRSLRISMAKNCTRQDFDAAELYMLPISQDSWMLWILNLRRSSSTISVTELQS